MLKLVLNKVKKRDDTRHKNRQQIVSELFTLSFDNLKGKTSNQTKEIVEKLQGIDEIISQSAPEWPINQISKMDLSILRLAVFELCFEKSQPPKAVIDEAVELGKEYGSENTFSFINGVLGTVVKKKGIKT